MLVQNRNKIFLREIRLGYSFLLRCKRISFFKSTIPSRCSIKRGGVRRSVLRLHTIKINGIRTREQRTGVKLRIELS